ncbi:von Willebrand factor type A domain protein [Planctomycetes bacterium Pan216]|uniref:von Willebrand factor type A domain protein n=1 Tax=Kolteria novifilia TaxID=2527975 RepID=A0A518B193_9BACT|nr:von Willebrand factor type A domain protein [Planctomycetes bacterium Pan216]
MNTSFRFAEPWYLLLLVPLGVAIWSTWRRRHRSAVLFSSVDLVRHVPVTLAQRLKGYVPWLRYAGLGLVIVALAQPQQGEEEFRVQTEGIAIEMCLDKSGSMKALDFEINGTPTTRLEVVKKVFRDFVKGRDDDKIGLVAFGGYASSLCPLTLDHPALLEILKTVQIPEPIYDSRGNIINQSLLEEELSTAIGDALAVAVDRIKDVDGKSKVIILLSDGESNAGVISPEEAAEAAKQLGVKIYTIGVGSTGPVPIEEDTYGGKRIVQRYLELDEQTLVNLAEMTGGKYFSAGDRQSLEEIYAEINQLEKTKSEGRLYTKYRELFAYLLYPGLVLILLEVFLSATRFRTLP